MPIREIKFRAWDKMKQKIAHVDLMHWNHPAPKDGWNPKYIKLRYDTVDFSELIPIGYQSPQDDGHKSIVIMQYTGLKDKNGVDIYEGDILETEDRIVEVFWHKEAGQWDTRFIRYIGERKTNGLENAEWQFKAKVIGNIYESKSYLS